jgi:hypothetical protein
MGNSLVLALIIAFAILTVLFIVIAVYIRKREGGRRGKPDYRAFFILGISFLPIGIATENPGLWGTGVVFMVLGLANRGKWKKEPGWSELDPEKRRTRFLIILGLTVLLAAAVAFYLLAKNNLFG